MPQRAGVVGLGDMGSGIAGNLIRAGFETSGYDPDTARLQAFSVSGGRAAASAGDAGIGSDAVFVMVMNGEQAHSVICGDGGLTSTMSPGSIILLTATVSPGDARDIAGKLAGSGIDLVDSPVSGGFPGAQAGTLTMMASAPSAVLERARPVMEAVSSAIYHVGTEAGMGQTVKACLQSLIGSVFTATFEASVLAAAAGVDAETIQSVFSNSSAGSGASNTALDNIVTGKFEKSGSHIRTMYKDMTLAMDLARDLGVPLFTASAAMQLFQAGITRYPDGDNWAVTKITEEIVGHGLRRRDNQS
ncbi:MAG: NAD(P)-dependent oxidoreductase [Rhodobacteraceae bacterium]|nr:NAD(P)-dependent oxidoreductase [Paracoccaceae bacterium]